MSSSFLTVEDINTTVYRNQGFWWYEIDTSKISSDADYTDVKYDFCKVSRETGTFTYNNHTYPYKYTFEIDTPYWTKAHYNGTGFKAELSGNILTAYNTAPYLRLRLYMGPIVYDSLTALGNQLVDDKISLNYEELNTEQPVYYWSGTTKLSKNCNLVEGYNEITNNNNTHIGYLLVNLVKSDFRFNCIQFLNVGQVNTVRLGTNTHYKPNGSMIGDNTPTITVEYNNQIIPVTYDTNDYYFNLDLTDITEPSKVKFKVIIEANKVINHTETDVTLQADYGLISNLTHLTRLATNGGIGKLNTNITLTAPLTISKDIVLVGKNKTINCNGYNIIISKDKTFKADNLTFTGGVNTIKQKTGSQVELTNTTFTECTGLGSCIKCDIDLDSLDNPNDYITILTGCTFTDNETAILHGGELTINDCNFSITNEDYLSSTNPSFLYLTDGEANITGSTFDITVTDTINSDLMFGPALFTIGETAVINGRNHDEWSGNNQTGFLGLPYNNRSSINLTYYYDLISANVNLSSSNGYCHAVSGEDYLFKTNITLTRSE